MRKLVAALACRATSTRLYAKPLQNLSDDITILDQMLDCIALHDCVSKVVLGVSEGVSNLCFTEFAQKRSVPIILGDEKDVLSRLVKCGRAAGATDILRVTSENPFVFFDLLPVAWQRHLDSGNDVTATDGGPLGTHIEIFKLDVLEESHNKGNDTHRSEHCDLYVMENLDKYKVEIIPFSSPFNRADLRLTVDYPEDLVVCREVYKELAEFAPNIPLDKIIEFLDEHPEINKLNQEYPRMDRIWPEKLYVK